MPSAKLQILSVDNFSQMLGSTDYAVFTCMTDSKETISVAVTHNALTSRAINIELLDNLVGSTIVANDSVDLDGVVTSGVERVQGIVDGSFINERTGKAATLLTLNRSNCSIIKSETYIAETKDLIGITNAKLKSEEKRQRRLDALKRAAERRQTALVAVEESQPELEVNEEF